MPREVKLNDKQLKALSLLNEGTKSIKEVAREVGWKPDYLYDLIEGNVSKAGKPAELFQLEMQQIDKNLTKRIKSLVKRNKSLALQLINEVLHAFRTQQLGLDEIKILTQINATLAKETPQVEIGSLSYNYTKGLSVEELLYEYNRLKSLAEGSSNRGAVQASFERRPGILPSADSTGSANEEFNEDNELSADGEAGEVS